MDFFCQDLSPINDRNVQCDQRSPITEIEELIINCVKTRNLRLLDLLLYEPDSHLNCLYYGENMLMLATRMGYEDVAKFLIENGVDYNFEKKIFYKTITENGMIIDFHSISCREMAYRHQMFDIVGIIDFLNNNYFRYYPKPKLELRDRSEKPGMFFDVVSLHEEFFTGEYFESAERTTFDNSVTLDDVNFSPKKNFGIRSRSENGMRFSKNNQTKENKSSFLRKRTTSAKNKTNDGNFDSLFSTVNKIWNLSLKN